MPCKPSESAHQLRATSPTNRHRLARAGVRFCAGLGIGLPLATPAFALDLTTAAGSKATSAALGPWIFASIALVLVAALAWSLGRLSGRRQGRSEARSRRTDSPTESTATSTATTTAAAANGRKPAAASAAAADDAAAISYALSHDLRAPLRVVEGFARILKEDYGRQLDRMGNDHLDRLLGAAGRMHAMIEGMLSLAQLSSKPQARQRINLSQMAQAIISEFRVADASRSVQVHIAPDLVGTGDPTLLRQMMENLLSNAWKYSARAPQARISFRQVEKGGQPVFEVADNGAGFDMRSAGRLFGLFQRLHGQSDFPGTGLGLASVQRIVKLHGGRIWAEAEPGRGARFYFTLPGSPSLP